MKESKELSVGWGGQQVYFTNVERRGYFLITGVCNLMLFPSSRAGRVGRKVESFGH